MSKQLLLAFVLIFSGSVAGCRSSAPTPVAEAPAADGSPVPTFAMPATLTAPPLAPTNTPEKTATPEPTPTPAPTAAPIDALRTALEDKLGVSTREGPRLIRAEITPGIPTLYVDWNINDYLSEDGLQRNAKTDAVALLRVVAENSEGLEYDDVALSGFFPLVDGLGNTRDAMIVQVWYDRSVIEQINFDNFYDQIYTSAKTARLHDLIKE